MGAAQPGKPVESIPEDIAHIDAAISRLGQIDKRVIVAYYTRYEPPDLIARKLQMRVRQFQAVLRRARWRIGGYMAAME
jgi:DNA-directed RNA polymerase specialized sigma24 family protein